MRVSKRKFSLIHNIEIQWLTVLCEDNIIPSESRNHRIYIEEDAIELLKEGVHFITCPHCHKKMSSVTRVHFAVCVETPVKYCELYLNKRKKTEQQKEHQSKVLKSRFQTEAGQITREQIGQASRKLNSDPDYKERKIKKSLEVQNRPDIKLNISLKSRKMWADPEFRIKMKKYAKENIGELRESAKRARQFSKKQSKLHIGYKKTMLEEGLTGFISEYSYGYYSIDEADPLAKVAIEIDGCYWHGCASCGFEGDPRIKSTDKRKSSYLKNRGWIVLHIKEHEIKRDPRVGIEMIRNIQLKRVESHKALLKANFFKGTLKVKSMVDKGSEPIWTPLQDILRHNTPHKEMYKISTDIGSVIVTEDHSLFSWPDKDPVRASELKEESLIVGLPGQEFGPIKVIGIEIVDRQKHTYDVSVPEAENAVLDSGILVHNTYSISGVSLDIDKSSKYQAIKDEFIAEYDKLVDLNKQSIKIIVGLRQQKYGVGIQSALGPMSRPGVQSRRNLVSAGQGGF